MTNPPLAVYSWGADTTAANAHKLPDSLPVIWPYVTGTPGVQWTADQIRDFPRSQVIRVNQGYENDDPFHGDEFDIETGAWNTANIIEVVAARRAHQWSTRLYGTYDTYASVIAALAAQGLRRSVFWRIADWDLTAHLADAELWGDVYAGQWASPASNPRTPLPGTVLTLAEAGADLNVIIRESTAWEG